MHPDAVAIVLAGGAARRLGPLAAAGGKAALVAGGRTLLERVTAALAAEVPRVVVVAPPGMALPAVTCAVEVVRDTAPGSGPLAAVRDGLAHAHAATRGPRVAVLCACDLPLLAPGLIRLLLDRAAGGPVRWVLPVVAGHPQPLLSVLALDALPDIERLLAAGRSSLRDLAAALGPRGILEIAAHELRAADAGLDSFRDVDTPADLAEVVRRTADRPRGA